MGSSTKTVTRDEETLVRYWRTYKFREMGFSPEQTEELVDLGIDYRRASLLLARGCSHEMFLNITR